ncbi:hypothetical protein [Okeania sp. SIO2B3]|uniref:hypothetical protein n=1 Tax=Okeania sp. SIO2B3 TaxID=2607784 RepID=UPI0013BEF9C3|nr:hypothetical protein [Okeania sp. SIO2B3]NET45634.1 hypothetical protein [Okeania sp. SIO2B3]
MKQKKPNFSKLFKKEEARRKKKEGRKKKWMGTQTPTNSPCRRPGLILCRQRIFTTPGLTRFHRKNTIYTIVL